MKKRDTCLVIIILIICIGITSYFVKTNYIDNGKNNTFESELYCEKNNDCVVAACCHPDSCVNFVNAPKCEGVFCTQECQPGTLDCNQGSCGCVNNKCTPLIR